jgi:photosystem II stability/assembly factor-like uncharacterized protein
MKYPFQGSVTGAIFLFLFTASAVFSQWASQSSGTQYPLQSIYFINSNTGFVGSQSNNTQTFVGGEIIRTTNGGMSWQQVLLDTHGRISDFHFFNSNTGFAVGGSYSMVGRIFKTTNGGVNWSNITPASITSYLWDIQFINQLTGFVSGTYGVFKTTDGGVEWTPIFSMDHKVINLSRSRISFIDANTGYYLADSGKVHKTVNGGINWQQMRNSEDFRFADIKFLNVNTGLICGENGKFYKTTDAGNSWNNIDLGLSSFLFGLHFNDQNTGYLSAQRYAFKTTNGGNNWTNIFDVGSRLLYSVYFTDANTGYMASDTGTVYKTTTGGVIGINPISTQIPNDFSLSQNYPNPFNPTTNIKFAVPRASFVKLAVYDMLGREVESLVNEQLSPGTYEVNWNAVKFSSGIYLYKLTTNDFNMVKKMSLIK